MSEFLLDKVQKLKSDGLSFDKIRAYLKNDGITDEEITDILKRADEKEIHNLYSKEKTQQALHLFIASIVFFIVGLSLSIYHSLLDGGMDPVIIVFLASFPVYSYVRYRNVRSNYFSTSKIIRENFRQTRKND